MVLRLLTSLSLTVFTITTSAAMTAGCNFWNIGWESTAHFFASGVNWTTTTNPWNTVLINELKEAHMTCLRFMDWNVVNYSCVKDWNQRIPRTANHYNSANTIPCFKDNYVAATNTHNLVWNGETHYGVAVEWQIDLCNRTGADLWINVPATATADFEYQLAGLIDSLLDSTRHVYVEWANEVWNWGFTSTVYARDQAIVFALDKLNYNNAYVEPWRAYAVYASVRLFEQFERVFGKNSPRLVKVIAGQVGYHWPGFNYNHMVNGDLAALANTTINPNAVTIDAYGMAPYMGGQSINVLRAAIDSVAQAMMWAKNSLSGTSIKLICYEAGADNYPDQSLALTRDPAQEQLHVDYLQALDDYCQGPINQYCMYGGCWGLKNSPGESESNTPKWRGWQKYWNGASSMVESPRPAVNKTAGVTGRVLFSNPVSDKLRFALDPFDKVSVTIFNAAGKAVMTRTGIGSCGVLNVNELKPGCYFLTLNRNNVIYRERFLVSR